MANPFDSHPNGAYSTVATAPSPATSGTSLVVAAGDGAKFKAGANAALRKVGNALPIEIVRVTAVATDTLTITRAQESTAALSVDTTYEIYQGPTAKTLTDIENILSGLNAAIITDDFPAGSAGKGALQWFSNAGTGSQQNSVANHPGIYQVATAASTNATAALYLIDLLLPADTFFGRFVAKMSDATAANQYWVGFKDSNASTDPTNGLYFRVAATAPSHWFAVARASSTETAVDMGVAVDTSWHDFTIRRIDGSTIGFSIDGGTEQTITTNVPTAVLWAHVDADTNANALSINFQADLFTLILPALTR